MWKDKIKRVLDSCDFIQQKRQERQQLEATAWRAIGSPLPVPHIVKSMRIRALARQFSCKTFVETGTCLGEMVVAVCNDFERIYSVELSPILVARARDRLAKRTHVIVHEGNSAAVLPEIMRRIDGRALLWLDAHYSGGVTAGVSTDSPITQEVTIVAEQPGHVILIDDAHCFNGTGGYPTLAETIVLSARLFPQHTCVVRDNIIEILPRD